MLLVHGKDLLVGDGSRVHQVDGAHVPPLHQVQEGWEEFWQDGHGVGDAHDLGVVGQLGDEVAGVLLVGDGHSHANVEHVAIMVHEAVGVALHHRIRAAKMVRHVLFSERVPAQRMLVSVCEEAAAANVCVVHVELAAQLGQEEWPKEVVTEIDGELVRPTLQIVNGVVARAVGAANKRNHMGGANTQKLLLYLTVRNISQVTLAEDKLNPLTAQQVTKLPPNPSLAPVHQKSETVHWPIRIVQIPLDCFLDSLRKGHLLRPSQLILEL